jgi:hypothetical protein
MEFTWILAARSRSLWPAAIFGLIVLAAWVAGVIAERRRRADLEAFARRLRFAFTPGAWGGERQFAGYTPFDTGRSRRSSNLIEGTRNGVRWEAFDYRYSTGSGKNRRTHHWGVVVARVGLSFPRAVIRPEGFLDSIASLAGFDDINFESEAFSRRYHVSASDRQRIYDVIDPRMMEYLLSEPAVHWQLGPGVVMHARNGRFSPVEIEQRMGMIDGFLSCVPGHVRADAAGGGAN